MFAAPTNVIAAPSCGKALIVAKALFGVYIAGETAMLVQAPPEAVLAAVTVNCCNEPVDSRVCGLTANTLATVNTSPTVTVAEPVPPSMLIVDWPSVVIVPFTKIVSLVERVPVVCCLID